MTTRVELWGLCRICQRWFYIEKAHCSGEPVCPVCAAPPHLIVDRLKQQTRAS